MTDSSAMYQSRIQELEDEQGEYTHEKAALHYNKHILDEKADNLMELRYTDRRGSTTSSTTHGSSSRARPAKNLTLSGMMRRTHGELSEKRPPRWTNSSTNSTRKQDC